MSLFLRCLPGKNEEVKKGDIKVNYLHFPVKVFFLYYMKLNDKKWRYGV